MEFQKFDQTSFARLRDGLKKLDDNLFKSYGLVHLGQTSLKDYNRHLKFSLDKIQLILSDFENTQFPYNGK